MKILLNSGGSYTSMLITSQQWHQIERPWA
jgi:hypothetical protein